MLLSLLLSDSIDFHLALPRLLLFLSALLVSLLDLISLPLLTLLVELRFPGGLLLAALVILLLFLAYRFFLLPSGFFFESPLALILGLFVLTALCILLVSLHGDLIGCNLPFLSLSQLSFLLLFLALGDFLLHFHSVLVCLPTGLHELHLLLRLLLPLLLLQLVLGGSSLVRLLHLLSPPFPLLLLVLLHVPEGGLFLLQLPLDLGHLHLVVAKLLISLLLGVLLRDELLDFRVLPRFCFIPLLGG